MEKLSYTQVGEILHTGSATIRALAEENAELRKENSAFRLESQCRDVARAMIEKGLHPELSEEEKIAQLKQRPDQLDTIRAAVEMTSSQDGMLPASLEDASSAPDGAGTHIFTTYLLTE
jgi:hypothetical protein